MSVTSELSDPSDLGIPGASPYIELDRDQWSALASSAPLPLTQADVEKLRGLGDPIDLAEVDAVYRPLTALLEDYIATSRERAHRTGAFLGVSEPPTPFIVAVAGSVAVGKSTTARLIAHLLARFPDTPRVDLVTTDGFLLPNRVLEERGLMARKGFPESYDRRALLRFMADVKSGAQEVRAPVYSHITYDIVPGEEQVVHRPDVLIVEGLNVLAPPRTRADGTAGLSVSDFFDFSVYVDARASWIRSWYIDRFMGLRSGAFADPRSYFHRYSSLSDAEAQATAESIWDSINGPNLEQNVRPTRGRARLVLTKNAHHEVTRVLLRKV